MNEIPWEAPGTAGAGPATAKNSVVVWSEGTAPQQVYPNDINAAIAEGLRAAEAMRDWDVVVANLGDAEQGLPDDVLARADVLIWWGHTKHEQVSDALAARIDQRVRDGGMGFIALHSAHFSKPNILLMGTACSFAAYVCDIKETLIKVSAADHPIAHGVAAEFTLGNEERYSDPYVVPPAEATPFAGTHVHNNGTREDGLQGYCWTVGNGRCFYFQAGHETRPIFFHPEVRKILANAVHWAARQSATSE